MQKKYELVGFNNETTLRQVFGGMAGVSIALRPPLRADLIVEDALIAPLEVQKIARGHGMEMRLRLCSLPLL